MVICCLLQTGEGIEGGRVFCVFKLTTEKRNFSSNNEPP